MPTHDFDLVVIGAGPAGERAACTASVLGKRVALIERSREVGGALVNTGTLPSKTLRETAVALSGLRARDLYGVDLSLRREATVADFLHHERQVTANERSRIRAELASGAVTLFEGEGTFVDANIVRVVSDGRDPIDVRGAFILIATGSSPIRPAEFAFEDARVYDSDEILLLESLPRSMIVIGAGVIGSEYASTFAALGARVTVVDGRSVSLPFLDAELSSALAGAMAKFGVEFVWNERVATCSSTEPGDVIVTLSSGRELRAEAVLVAAGRTSNTGKLALQNAGLTAGPRGLVVVDKLYRTAIPHIFAAGDVIGFPALASTSMEQARIAVCAAFGVGYKSDIAPILPAGIYTIPEVSSAGETEEQLREKGIPYVVGRARYADNSRGEIIGDNDGFLKLLFSSDGSRLLGVHVIGELATEVVHIGLMALLTESGLSIFDKACFNCPTLGELYKTAAYDALKVLSGLAPRT